MSYRAVLLGTAAAVLISEGRAADLPLVENADQYVRICDAFGEGFFYIPSTESCLKIGGHVRAEMHYVDGDPEVLRSDGTPEQSNAMFNNWTSRARGNVHFDTKTSSGIGLIETYIEIEATIGPDDYAEDYSETEMELTYGFVKVNSDLGTFTAGRTDSFFDFFSSDDYGTRVDIDDNTTQQTLFAYTLNGPHGFTGTLSIEDPKSIGRRLTGTDDYEGEELPDLVGNIKVEQEWGSAQIMGVVRQIHDKTTLPPDMNPDGDIMNDGGDDQDGIGWAAGAGAIVNLPLRESTFSTEVGYADGALAYITTDPGGIGDFAGPKGDDTNQAWMGRAGFLLELTDTVSTWLDGSFTHAEDDTNDDEYDFWAVVVGAQWDPNDDETLLMGPEVGYNNIDGDDPGEDGDLWGVMWRMESKF